MADTLRMAKSETPTPTGDEVRAAAHAWLVAIAGLPAEGARPDRAARRRVEGALVAAPAAVEALTPGDA